LRQIGEKTSEIPTKCYKVCLELSHRILSQTSRAEANTLTERTDPTLIFAALDKVALILGLHTEGAKLPIANIILLLKTPHALGTLS
jgi:hypothetical protein